MKFYVLRNHLFIFFIIACLFSSKAEANELAVLRSQNPTRVSMGVSIAGITLDIRVADLKVKGSGCFSGLNVGYEYHPPEAFYFCGQLSILSGNHGFSAYHHGHKISSHHKNPGFGGLSFDFGYTICCDEWLIIPYAGIGSWVITSRRSDHRFKEHMGYFAFGLKGNYSFNTCYDLGFNLKLFRSYHARKEFKIQDSKASSSWETPGAYLGLLGTFHFGECYQWDLQLEPYFLALSLGAKQLVYGVNLKLGYNF